MAVRSVKELKVYGKTFDGTMRIFSIGRMQSGRIKEPEKILLPDTLPLPPDSCPLPPDSCEEESL